jgi:hypothetical protein
MLEAVGLTDGARQLCEFGRGANRPGLGTSVPISEGAG